MIIISNIKYDNETKYIKTNMITMLFNDNVIPNYFEINFS